MTYPNRMLREAGLLKVIETDDGEHLDFADSKAWALADHQFSHVFVQDSDPKMIKHVARLFTKQPGIAEVLTAEGLAEYRLDHPRSGDVVLISEPNSWQAYYWWHDDAKAPQFARTVDIHRKPGYDPVELFFDARTKSIPLNAKLVHGSHGAPANEPANAACCSPRNQASSSAANWPIRKWPRSCSSSLRTSDKIAASCRRNHLIAARNSSTVSSATRMSLRRVPRATSR